MSVRRIAPALAHARSLLGGYVRQGNTEAAEQARRALERAKTEVTIRRAIEQAPSLDADTLARIRSLIPPAPGEGADG